MRNHILFIVFSICIITFSFAQEYQISGTVKSTQGIAITFANVLLLKATDSTVIKGTSTNEKGNFVMNHVLAGSYVLKASYIENSSKPMAVNVLSDITTDTLIIDNITQSLDEVVVSYQKPKLDRKADRLVFYVANSTLSEGNIWNLLKSTPTVTDIQGQLTVKGNSNIGVMINGRKLNLPKSDIINLLSGASANTVEAIEVITNPPSKYSAEDGMLIDIKMSKNLVAGYNGAIYNRYTQGVFAKHVFGTDHYFKANKTAFLVNYSFDDQKQISRYTDITNFLESGVPNSIWTANQDAITRRKRHNLSAFFDYDIDEKNKLSFSSINAYSPYVNRLYNTGTLIENLNGTLLSIFNTTNDSNQDLINTSFYADWAHHFQKKGTELSINGHYTYYDSSRGQSLITDFFDTDENKTGENDFTTLAEQIINLYSLQTDYITSSGKSSKWETGLRYACISSENIIEQEGFNQNQPGINPTEAGTFKYDEAIYAGYASYSGKWNKLKLKSGLRAEYTKTLGDLDTNVSANENNYFELFPTFSLKYTKSDAHEYLFNYYRRITRPRYNRINPFQYFQSNNIVAEGNPDLLPTIQNYLSLGYTFDNSYSLEAFYGTKKNQYQQQVFQDNEANLLRFVSTNIKSSFSYGIDAYIDKKMTSYWNFYFFVSAFYTKLNFIDLDSGQLIMNSRWTAFTNSTNNITFFKDQSLKANIRFAYFLPRIIGNTRIKSYNQLDITLRKTLWNKKVTLSMGMIDIFNQRNYFSSRRYVNQNNTSLSMPENRLFTFGFRYTFGNTKIETNKKLKRVEERKRI